MDLPGELRRGVDAALAGMPGADLKRAAAALSERYRGEVRDGRFHLADDLAARAYLATRLPATYAAIRASLAEVADGLPDWGPASLIDAGAGTGAALWAVADCWPDLAHADLVEASPAVRALGQGLAAGSFAGRVAWHGNDLTRGLPDLPAADIVTAAYLLGELPPDVRDRLIDGLWALTAGTLVVVEPGTPAGWTRMLAARTRLIAAGAHVIAPCPHASACPLAPPDWCHFAERVARSRAHRLAKGAELAWEDEKFIYVAASRQPGKAGAARVIARPRAASGRVTLKLCRPNGRAGEQLFSRRQGEVYRDARRVAWGERLAL
jgi:ribosomal protein RSM22 (predicted rRNA methylase)